MPDNGRNLKVLQPKTSHFMTSHVYKSVEIFNALPDDLKYINPYAPKKAYKKQIANYLKTLSI
jgi:hypothetical protein